MQFEVDPLNSQTTETHAVCTTETIPSEDLDLKPHGYTGKGHCKSNMLKWKYSGAVPCVILGSRQTMDHLLKCPTLSQECTTEDFIFS